MPGQTLDQVKENVAKALALDIPHLSLYSLILEHHTVFMNKMRRGKLNLPTEDLEAEMFEYIISEMEANGFEHYEISNFTKPGFESRHNLMYWDNVEYFGCGAGASGYLNGIRYQNRVPIQHYLKAVEAGNARLNEEVLRKEEMMEEELFWAYVKRQESPSSGSKKNLVCLLRSVMEILLGSFKTKDCLSKMTLLSE